MSSNNLDSVLWKNISSYFPIDDMVNEMWTLRFMLNTTETLIRHRENALSILSEDFHSMECSSDELLATLKMILSYHDELCELKECENKIQEQIATHYDSLHEGKFCFHMKMR